MEVFTHRIRDRIKKLIDSEAISRIEDFDPDFVDNLIKELKNTSKEVKQMNEEMTKKDKQVKF